MDVWYEYVCNWTANILLTYMVGLAIRAGFIAINWQSRVSVVLVCGVY